MQVKLINPDKILPICWNEHWRDKVFYDIQSIEALTIIPLDERFHPVYCGG